MSRLKTTLFLLVCFAATNIYAQKNRNLTAILELQMPDGEGKNGASVVWHPEQGKYYAAYAGNVKYPLAIFNKEGKRLSDDALFTQFDIRGMWYNPNDKKIHANGYAENGWINYNLNEKGVPTTTNIEHEGMKQPDEQAVGFYNPTAAKTCFLTGQQITAYSDKAVADEQNIRIYVGKTDAKFDESNNMDKDAETMPEEYNSTSAVYTNIKKAELGLYNATSKTVELYDIKTGLMTEKLQLPETAPEVTMFNFAYANGIFWLFDVENRKWIGYK